MVRTILTGSICCQENSNVEQADQTGISQGERGWSGCGQDGQVGACLAGIGVAEFYRHGKTQAVKMGYIKAKK